MKNIQAQFDTMLVNQAWYGLGFKAKVEALAGHFGGTVAITAAPVVAITRRTPKGKQETALPTRRTSNKAVKSTRYIGPMLFNLAAAPAAASYAARLLRALGRKAEITTSLQEVYQMVKEEVGMDPAFSFVSVAARAAWNALVRAVSV